MKIYIVIVILALALSSLFGCNKEIKIEVRTQTGNTISSADKKNYKPFPWDTKWFYKDLNTVFVSQTKNGGKGC